MSDDRTSLSSMTIGSMVIGSYDFNNQSSEDFIDAVRQLVDNGVNVIDTAPRYGNGTSEKIVGRAVKDIRDKVIIATKFGTYRSVNTFDLRDSSYRSIMRECENSLLNMGLEYIDIYINHWPDPVTPIDETMAALNDLRKRGLIKYVGFSNCDKKLLEEAQKYGKVDVVQCQFSLVDQSNRQLMEYAKSRGMSVMTYGSLGSGILTGSIRNREDINKSSHLSLYEFFQEPKFSHIMELLKTLDEIAESRKVTLPQIALKWSTQQEIVDTALVGIPNAKQGLENIRAFDWSLTTEEIKKINDEVKRLNIA